MKSMIACGLALVLLSIPRFIPSTLAEPKGNATDSESDIMSTPGRSHYEDDLTRHFDVEPHPTTRWAVTGVVRYDKPVAGTAANKFATYDDLWKDGFGASLELSYDLMESQNVHFSPYLSLGVDSFTGSTHRGNDEIVKTVDVDPDNLTLWTALLGFQLRSNNDKEDGFFWSGQVGGGLGTYDRVDSDLDFITLNRKFSNEEFYQSTTTWAFEASLRVGWATHDWSFFLGSGIRVIGGPDSSNRLNTDAGTFTFVPAEFGIEYKW